MRLRSIWRDITGLTTVGPDASAISTTAPPASCESPPPSWVAISCIVL
jgi:hypothetical protein